MPACTTSAPVTDRPGVATRTAVTTRDIRVGAVPPRPASPTIASRGGASSPTADPRGTTDPARTRRTARPAGTGRAAATAVTAGTPIRRPRIAGTTATAITRITRVATGPAVTARAIGTAAVQEKQQPALTRIAAGTTRATSGTRAAVTSVTTRRASRSPRGALHPVATPPARTAGTADTPGTASTEDEAAVSTITARPALTARTPGSTIGIPGRPIGTRDALTAGTTGTPGTAGTPHR